MRITAVETFLVDIPFAHPFVVWRGAIESKHHAFVRVETDAGITGWGEASPFLFYASETAEDVVSMIDRRFAPDLIGRDPRDVRAFRAGQAPIDGHLFAKAAVETALWDITAQSVDLPLHRLIGGAVRARIPIVTVLQSAAPEEMAREAKELHGRGFRRFKIKIGFGREQDVAMVAKVREALGPDSTIRVDAEESCQVKDALRIGRDLERFDIELFSQPVARTDWAGMALLRAVLPMPLLADEGVHSAEDVLHCARANAADMINIKVLKSGGLLASLEMAAVCAAANLPVVVGSMVESGIGSLLGAHFAAVLPGRVTTELCGPLLFKDDLLDAPIVIEEGDLVLNDRPGLGAAVALDRLKTMTLPSS